MNRLIVLRASGIQVTASNRQQALSYLAADVREFLRDWNYEVDRTEYTINPLTTSSNDVEISLDLNDPDGQGERIWTGTARFKVVVKAASESAATKAAKQVLTA